MALPAKIYVQEIAGTLYVNRTPEGAVGHWPTGDAKNVGVFSLTKEVNIRRVSEVSVEDVPPAQQSAQSPQN